MHVRNVRSLLLCTFLGASTPLLAQQHFDVEFQPSAPTTGDTVLAHVISEDGGTCFPDPAFSPVERTQHGVELTFIFTDACDPNFVGPAWDYTLGTFEPGTWMFTLQVCYSFPSPFTSYCEIDVATTFDVAPVDRIFGDGFE